VIRKSNKKEDARPLAVPRGWKLMPAFSLASPTLPRPTPRAGRSRLGTSPPLHARSARRPRGGAFRNRLAERVRVPGPGRGARRRRRGAPRWVSAPAPRVRVWAGPWAATRRGRGGAREEEEERGGGGRCAPGEGRRHRRRRRCRGDRQAGAARPSGRRGRLGGWEARGARAGGVRPGRQRPPGGGRREGRRQRAAPGRAQRGRRPGTRAAALRPRQAAHGEVSAAGRARGGGRKLGAVGRSWERGWCGGRGAPGKGLWELVLSAPACCPWPSCGWASLAADCPASPDCTPSSPPSLLPALGPVWGRGALPGLVGEPGRGLDGGARAPESAGCAGPASRRGTRSSGGHGTVRWPGSPDACAWEE
jgi:hypothetical protein